MNKLLSTSLKRVLVLVMVASVQALTPASAQNDQTPAILYNNTSIKVDYYVLLTDGSAKLLNSLEPGAQVTDQFYAGEVILVAPHGDTTTALSRFTHDGTPNSVLAINDTRPAQTPSTGAVAAPPTKRAADNNAQAGGGVEQSAPKQQPVRSAQFERWIQSDKPNYEERVKNDTTYQAGFQEKFRMEDQMRKGYNVLKMDPSRLTIRGLRGNAPDLIKKLDGSSVDWGIRELGLAMPNDLVLLPERASTRGIEETTVMFSSHDERSSSSLNVGFSGNVEGGQAKSAGGRNKAGGGGSGKIGISRDERSFESNNQSMIRKQIVGQAYWVIYAKEYMQLADGFKRFLLNPNSLRSYADFKDMFEQYGTHWSIATLFGGYIRYDEMFDSTELAESITKSLSVEASATIPIKSASVGTSVGFTQSDTNEMRSKQSQGKASFESQGGQPGAGFGMWNMASPTQADNYVPLKVELRSIHELIWPELMGVTDPAEASRVHALRVTTGQMLQRYLDETQGLETNDDWSPRVYNAKIKQVVVTQDDDEGSYNEPDFYGWLSAFSSKGPNFHLGAMSTVYYWSAGTDNPATLGKGKRFPLESELLTISVPAEPKQAGLINGKTLYRPSFPTDQYAAVFSSNVEDVDETGDNESVSGSIIVKLSDVDAEPNGIKMVKKEFEQRGVGIEMEVEVKRVDYVIENTRFELLPLPSLKRENEGALIASQPQGAVVALANSSATSAKPSSAGAVSGLAGSDTGFLNFVHEGTTFELNYTSSSSGALKTSPKDQERFFVAWTKKARSFPVRFVTENGQQFMRAQWKGKTYELSWTGVGKGALGYGRYYAVWTQSLGKNPVTKTMLADGRVSLRTTINGKAFELNWSGAFHGGQKDGYGRKAGVWHPNLSRLAVTFSSP